MGVRDHDLRGRGLPPQGLRHAPLRAASAHAARQGFCEAIAILGCPNLPSEKLHESLGFSRIGTFAKAGYKLGQWHDVKWYGLELRPREDAPADPIPFCALPRED